MEVVGITSRKRLESPVLEIEQHLPVAKVRKIYSDNVAQGRAYQHNGDVYGEVHVHVHQVVGTEWLQVSQASGLQNSSLPDGILVPRRLELVKRRTKTDSRDRTLRLRSTWVPWFWTITLRRSYGNWNVQLQVFRHVPADSKIFKLCEVGDLPGVQKLLASGRASPLDLRSGAQLPFHVAMSHHHVDLCQWLLKLTGLSEDMYPNPLTWIHLYIMKRQLTKVTTAEAPQAILRLLVQTFGLDCDDLLDPSCPAPEWWMYCRNQESIQVMQNALSIPYADLPLATRFGHAICNTYSSGGWNNDYTASFEQFKTILGPRFPVEEIAILEDDAGNSALHLASSRSVLFREDWIHFFSDCIQAGANVHHRNGRGQTPLAHLMCDIGAALNSIEAARRLFREWLKLLDDNGVDLLTYGQKESVLFPLGRDTRSPLPPSVPAFRVAGFLYGKTLDSWDIDIVIFEWQWLWRPLVRHLPCQWPEEYAQPPPLLPWEPQSTDTAALNPELHSLDSWSAYGGHQWVIQRTTFQRYTEVLDRTRITCDQIWGPQDDHGFICRQAQRDTVTNHRYGHRRRRTRSEPFPSSVLDNPENLFPTDTPPFWTKQRRWARPISCHRCNVDGMWRLGPYNPRNCRGQGCGLVYSTLAKMRENLSDFCELFHAQRNGLKECLDHDPERRYKYFAKVFTDPFPMDS